MSGALLTVHAAVVIAVMVVVGDGANGLLV